MLAFPKPGCHFCLFLCTLVLKLLHMSQSAMFVADLGQGRRLDRQCRTTCHAEEGRQDLHPGHHLRSVTVKMTRISQMQMMVSIQFFHGAVVHLTLSVGMWNTIQVVEMYRFNNCKGFPWGSQSLACVMHTGRKNLQSGSISGSNRSHNGALYFCGYVTHGVKMATFVCHQILCRSK